MFKKHLVVFKVELIDIYYCIISTYM